MGQIIGGAAKPKRCNLSQLSQLGTPAAGEYILVSSDNSMNAAGQGNFDAYVVGDGKKAADVLKLKFIDDKLIKEVALYAAGAYTNWTDGKYIISTNGLVSNSSVNSVTGYIDISDYQQIKCTINKSTSVVSIACVAFYDSDKVYLNTRILPTTGSESGLSDIIAEIPEGAKYAKFTCRTAEKSSWNLSGVIKAKGSLTDEVVGAYKKRLTSEDIISGHYRSISGSIATSSAFGYSVPIKVSCGDKVILYDSYIETSVAFITRVSENGDYISVVKAGESSNGVLVNYEVEINFDGYISITANLLEYKMLSIIKATIHKVIEDSKADLSAEIDTLNASVGELTQIVAEPPIDLTSQDITTGYYRTINGGLASLSGYCYSKPFYVKKGTKIITTEAVELVAAVSVISEVDSDNGYIRTLKAGTGNAHIYNYEVEQDCYIGLSFLVAQLAKFRIVPPNLKNEIDGLYDVAIKTENTTRLLAFGANPLQTIIRECGYGCLLKTWGFIGDSYTSGETPAYDGSTLKYLDCYKWSWGQQFMKIIGSEGYNFSNGGQTAKGWLRSQGVVHDDTYYGGVGGGDWRLAQTELKQGYIISLGINDKNRFGTEYLGSVYSLGDVSTDVDTSDYTQNNENTYAGCYAGIVQRILSVQPKAKIFCLTQFQDDLETLNDVVRDIAALFPNNVFVIDLHDYALDITGEQYYMSNGHPTPLGYAFMAACINTYVDYIIRNNKQKFMDVTLIGSDYTLSSN